MYISRSLDAHLWATIWLLFSADDFLVSWFLQHVVKVLEVLVPWRQGSGSKFKKIRDIPFPLPVSSLELLLTLLIGKKRCSQIYSHSSHLRGEPPWKRKNGCTVPSFPSSLRHPFNYMHLLWSAVPFALHVDCFFLPSLSLHLRRLKVTEMIISETNITLPLENRPNP